MIAYFRNSLNNYWEGKHPYVADMVFVLLIFFLWLGFVTGVVKAFKMIILPFWRVRRAAKCMAFFHPYCDAGGGGERVLWRAISVLQRRLPNWTIAIYTANSPISDDTIVRNARLRFNIEVDGKRIKFIRLKFCFLIRPAPVLTLALQLLGGFLLGLEAIWRYLPCVFIDSTGLPSTLPVFRFVGDCQTACYVHYPIISREMIDLVRNQTETYNNKGWIAKWPIFTYLKVFYYTDLKLVYAFCIVVCECVMTNGSWTNRHMQALRNRLKLKIVYPPCDVETLALEPNGLGRNSRTPSAEELYETEKRINILSVGQIRPEKNHQLQLAAFVKAREMLSKSNIDVKLTLTIAGGCRNEEDEARLFRLKRIANEEYELVDEVDVMWRINIPFSELRKLLHSSMIGIHTMQSEHFGISVVEGLAAGNIMIAHNSGGPKLDIIGGYESPNIDDVVPCGYLATTADEYAEQIMNIITMTRELRDEIRAEAKLSATRFSNEQFDNNFCSAVKQLLPELVEN